MADLSGVTLESHEVGALPVIGHFLDRLGLEEILERHLAPRRTGRPPRVPAARVLRALVANVLLSRAPLYAVSRWAARMAPDLLGVDAGLLGDDRIGRALDLLFDAEHAPLVTDLVLAAVRRFGVATDEFHNDTTSITVSGQYERQKAACQPDRPPRITYGFNKDHRPDLKQLVWSVTASSDGTIPVHFRLYDGNTTDDRIHIGVWQDLCQLSGRTDFLYVADSKLCTSENLRFIDGKGGRFLTVMPRTRSEDGWFKDYLGNHAVDWQEVRREPHPRRKTGPHSVWWAFESPQRSKEGFRILWYLSSQKREIDSRRRHERLGAARTRIEALARRRGRHRFGGAEQATDAVRKILDEHQVGHLLRVDVHVEMRPEYKQARRGRPGPNTAYKRIDVAEVRFALHEDAEAIRAEARFDGLFPLITNDETLTAAEALAKYKHQPFLEKRHQQLKSVLDALPVYLKKPQRIASLLLVDFLALLVASLIERELRLRMKAEKVASLPVYPEDRCCKAPTAESVFGLLEGQRRHELRSPRGELLRTCHDELPAVSRDVLRLLGVNLQPYGS
jgi:transposase